MTSRQRLPVIRSRAGRPYAVRAAVVAALLAAAAALGGCTPGPAPKPTPTPLFTSEADAFKAAEQVFRDYIDAVNQEQNDPSAHPQSYLAGSALDEDIKSVRDLKSAGRTITGNTIVARYTSNKFQAAAQSVKSTACLDVSGTRVLDGQGKDVTANDRPKIVAIDVTITGMSNSPKIVAMGPSSHSCPS